MSDLKAFPKPVLFLVTGAWHGGWMYDSIVKSLVAAGYSTSIIQLPSTGIRTGPPLDKTHDVEHVRREILKEIKRGRQVSLICHSYAGVPTCDAVEGLGIEERTQRNEIGGVISLVFVAAFVLEKGCTVTELNARYQEGQFNYNNGMLFPVNPENIFYNDLPHDMAAQLSRKLEPHSAVTFLSPLNYEAYRFIPSSYLMCEKDKAITLQAQEKMLSNTSRYFDLVDRLDSGHLPFISRPEETVQFILKTFQNREQQSVSPV